jgi:hypothetical protein
MGSGSYGLGRGAAGKGVAPNPPLCGRSAGTKEYAERTSARPKPRRPPPDNETISVVIPDHAWHSRHIVRCSSSVPLTAEAKLREQADDCAARPAAIGGLGFFCFSLVVIENSQIGAVDGK